MEWWRDGCYGGTEGWMSGGGMEEWMFWRDGGFKGRIEWFRNGRMDVPEDGWRVVGMEEERNRG